MGTNNFVRALVSRYSGKIKYYELWNEANLAETYSGNVSEMVALAKNAYSDIKELEPNATVLSPSASTIGIAQYSSGCNIAECWLDLYLMDGGGSYSDAIAFHSYAYFTSDTAAADLGIGCPVGDIESCAGTPLVKQINSIRSLFDTFGLSSTSLFDTEGGIPSNIAFENLSGTAEQQAAFLSRWYIIQAGENVSSTVWFSEFFSTGGLAGFGNSSSVSQMNLAYNMTHEWLEYSRPLEPCSLAPSYVWTCNITRVDGSEAQIVFANSSSMITYDPPQSYNQYQALNGSIFAINKTSINVGMSPVLLFTKGNSTSMTQTETNSSSILDFSSSVANPNYSEALLIAVIVIILAALASGIFAWPRRKRIT